MATWTRSLLTLGHDPRGPIGMTAVPTVRVENTSGTASGPVRITLLRDDAPVARFTLPTVPDASRVAIDGCDGRVTAFYGGDTRPLFGYVQDWEGQRLGELDIAHGAWSVAVDQDPAAAVRLRVDVIATPVGRR